MEFWSQYVFYSFSYYPEEITWTWSYGEAHHFKGPHDGIGELLNKKFTRKLCQLKL